MFFLFSLLSVVVIGGVAATGGGGGGGSSGGSVPVSISGWDDSVNQNQVNSYKTTEYNTQYGLNNIKAAEAYSLLQTNGKAIGGDGVKVFVTDTGVNLSHFDIKGNDFKSLHSDPSDDWDGHGTNVASIIAGVRGNNGVHGVAFNADIISVRC